MGYTEKEKSTLSMARTNAYNEGEYELDEGEGFYCEDCGAHTLTTELLWGDDVDDDVIFESACIECKSRNVERASEDINYAKIEEKLNGSE